MRRMIGIAALLVACTLAPAAAADGLDRLLAPAAVCPHQDQAAAPTGVQEVAMACMVNYARARAGREPLRREADLSRSADHKAADIVRCDSFSHTACGRDFTYWIRQVDYAPGDCWSAGENIAWGTRKLATPRSIFRSWIRSPGHRANILSADYRDLGVGLRAGTLDGYRGAHVWVQHFAAPC